MNSNLKILHLIYHTAEVDYYARYTIPILKKYAEKHQYTFKEITKRIDYIHHPTWFKLLYIADNLGEDKPWDWVIFTDVDFVPLNHCKDLRDYIKPEYDIIMDAEEPVIDRAVGPFPKDWGNTGLMFVKNCAWTKQFLTETYHDPKFKGYWPKEGEWHEQTAIHLRRLKEQEVSKHIFIYPTYSIFHQWDISYDFIHTFGKAHKLKLINGHLDKYIKW